MTASVRTAVTLARPAAPLPATGMSAADAIYRNLFDSFGPDSGGRISPLEVLTRLERCGQRFSIGDSAAAFCLQSVSKTVSYCLALTQKKEVAI